MLDFGYFRLQICLRHFGRVFVFGTPTTISIPFSLARAISGLEFSAEYVLFGEGVGVIFGGNFGMYSGLGLGLDLSLDILSGLTTLIYDVGLEDLKRRFGRDWFFGFLRGVVTFNMRSRALLFQMGFALMF